MFSAVISSAYVCIAQIQRQDDSSLLGAWSGVFVNQRVSAFSLNRPCRPQRHPHSQHGTSIANLRAHELGIYISENIQYIQESSYVQQSIR
jgi:hypothetical protein